MPDKKEWLTRGRLSTPAPAGGDAVESHTPPSEADKDKEQIADLLGAFRTTGSYRGSGNTIYLGLTIDGRPVVSSSPTALVNNADQKTLAAYQDVGRVFPECPVSGFIPLVFRVIKAPTNFEDTREGRIEKDILNLGFTKTDGLTLELAINEFDMLDCLTDAPDPWQSVGSSGLALDTTKTIVKHTLFVRSQRQNYAILFAPPARGESNQAIFQKFMVNAVAQIIFLDLKQPAERPKGFVDIAKHYRSKAKSGGGLLSAFIEVDTTELSEFIGKNLIEISKDEADLTIKEVVNKFKLDRLDLPVLKALVADLQRQAHRIF